MDADLTPDELLTERAYQWLSMQGARDGLHYRCICDRWVHHAELHDHKQTCTLLHAHAQGTTDATD